ncbi:hypothetical protein K493DRAFT_340016 [Basidiobolus meristosporus CBS 931.73]|uniref:Uncharacterized protein n=1 Tax=Basidiobolus meristosporus CBS 931.73 TaxID=1314790 RepID=A0A1Y1XY99_9FUNG|nr:hypothetical protein K493DRAFT_340016 [Basidiobolus meristosporus CBS 931.73]|eukprot:ORX90456.1 hypothetical protein K493DRAFT_340016 [Basidiobolus meristosporus CBS 931.73]
MKYGYVEDVASSYFTKTLTPPFLSKIGLSCHHPQFAFLGYKKSILNWMRKNSHLKVELNDNTQPGIRNITFEITNLYNIPFSPYRCNIRATKLSDYQEPSKENPAPENTRILIVRSGKSLGDILLLLRICWARSSRTRYICTGDELELDLLARHLTSNQEPSVPITLPLEPSPSYHSIERPLSCELPSYYSSGTDRRITSVV